MMRKIDAGFTRNSITKGKRSIKSCEAEMGMIITAMDSLNLVEQDALLDALEKALGPPRTEFFCTVSS